MNLTKLFRPYVEREFLLDFSTNENSTFLFKDDNGEEIPPFVCKYSDENGHLLATADESGMISIHNTLKSKEKSLVHCWNAHKNAIFDVSWMPRSGRLLSASGDHFIKLWDIEKAVGMYRFFGHTKSVKSVDFCPDSQFLFASGGRDGHLLVYDTRCNNIGNNIKPVMYKHYAHSKNGFHDHFPKRRSRKAQLSSEFSVTSVVFYDERTLISSGANDGTLKVWDLRRFNCKAMPKVAIPYPGSTIREHGYSAIAVDHRRTRLFANCMNNAIYQFDCLRWKPKPVAKYRGHLSNNFYIKIAVSPDDNFLLSGSADAKAYIWKITEPRSGPVTLLGHREEVNCVSWSTTDLTELATGSDDCSVRIWRLDRNGKKLNMWLGKEGYAERSNKAIPPTPIKGSGTPKKMGSVHTPTTISEWLTSQSRRPRRLVFQFSAAPVGVKRKLLHDEDSPEPASANNESPSARNSDDTKENQLPPAKRARRASTQQGANQLKTPKSKNLTDYFSPMQKTSSPLSQR